VNEEIQPVEEVAVPEKPVGEVSVSEPKLLTKLKERLNTALHSLSITMGIAGLLFVSFWFVPHTYQGTVTIWINPFILLLSIGKLYVDIGKHAGKPASTALTILASLLLVICSGVKTIADFRTKLFEPIRSVSGILYVTFDRLFTPGQVSLYAGFDRATLTKAPLTNTNAYYSITISKVEYGQTGKKVGTAILAEQVTQIKIYLTGESSLIRNHLEEISADSFSRKFDYLRIDSLDFRFEETCSFTGILHVILNGEHEYHRSLPRQIVKRDPKFVPILSTPIVVPLNEKALELMYQYTDNFPRDPEFILQ